MKLVILSTFLVAYSIVSDVLSQTPVVTYLLSRNQSLQCLFTNEALTVTWRDSDTTPDPTSLATYKLLPEKVIDVENDGGKYSNFEYSANDVNFNLAIINVQEEDGGNYLCLQSPGGTRSNYFVMVEVPPDDTVVTCSSCMSADSADSSCNCQCSASGGSSPSILRLEWKINDEVLASQPPTENITDGGQIVYSSSAVVPVKEDNSVVTCAVTGFENQDEIAAQFPSRVEAEQTLRSPVCSVSVSDDNCPNVELSCSCDAYPSVPDSPEYFSYYSRQGEDDTSSDTLLNDTLHVVTPGGDIHFVCTGDNGLGISTKSPAVPNPCLEATTTPTMTLMATSPPESDNLGLIIGVVIAAVVVGGGAIGFSVYWFGIRTSDQESVKRSNNEVGISTANKEKSDKLLYESTGNNFDPPGGADNNTVTASTNETTNSAAPVYGVVNKSTKKKSDNTDGNGVNSKLQSEPDQVEYAAVNKPKSDPQPAPRSSKPPGNNTEPEKMELQYADIDHSNRGRSNEIHQPADAPTEYATVQSVIV